MSNDYEQARRDLKDATDEVKRSAEATSKELKNLGDVTRETKETADKALSDMIALRTRLDDAEQKSARRGNGETQETRSLGQRFIASEEVKAVLSDGDRFKGRVTVEMKAITSASSSGSSGTTGLAVADRQPGIIQATADRRLTIRDLLMPGRTSAGAIDYVRETGYSNNAAPVSENPSAGKPQSDLNFELVTLGVKTVAHYVQASRQILADAPMLASYIDGRLRYGLAFKEEDQLLNGNGTGQSLKGLMSQATAYAQPSGVTVKNESMIDRLRLAMLQVTLAELFPTGHLLNPTDWASIEVTKDTQGRYVWTNPAALAGPTLWGLPVVQSNGMTAGSFLTGSFRDAAQIFDREDATVTISTEDRDNFVKNMVTLLAEERLALAVYRPQALIKGTFPTAPASASGD